MRKAQSTYHNGRSVFVTVAGETVEATFRHPFWVVRGEELAERPRRDDMAPVTAGATTPGRWVDAGDLRVGDEMLLRDGRIERVEALGFGFLETAVYNFDIEGLHCYAVGRSEVLVHNGNAGPVGGGGDAGGGDAGDGRGGVIPLQVLRNEQAIQRLIGEVQNAEPGSWDADDAMQRLMDAIKERQDFWDNWPPP